MATPNLLYYGDNLDVLRRHVESESVDLIYLDPPFNSNRSYNVLFGSARGEEAQAQIEAFDDTWTWTPEADALYLELIRGGAPSVVADAIQSMHGLLGENAVLAYLVMMAARLVELHRVLKPTGSMYLHCAPTASHYLKLLMDAVFGPKNFRNEIIWERTNAHNMKARMWPRTHDTLLLYTKSDDFRFDQQFKPYGPEQMKRFKPDDQGRLYKAENLTFSTANPSRQFDWRGTRPPPNRSWGMSLEELEGLYARGRILLKKDGTPRMDGWKIYLDETQGKPVGTVWTDIERISNTSAERLGYPTQKPLALLNRIIESSSEPGDLILDPFCGCGTTVDAAQALGRRWIGIDVTYIAIDLIRRRLEDAYSGEAQFVIDGIPRDVPGAEALFRKSPFDFERWAVSLVYGQPNERQVGDRGIDGVIRFPLDRRGAFGRVLVSVKGGRQVNPAFVRDLLGTINAEGAAMGVLVTLVDPTRGMVDAANRSGSYVWLVDGRSYPKIQLVTVQQLLDGYRLAMPPALTPYLSAPRHVPAVDQLSLG